MGDGLLHDGGVHHDLVQARIFDGAGAATRLHGLAQQPLDTLLTDPLAPAGGEVGSKAGRMLKKPPR